MERRWRTSLAIAALVCVNILPTQADPSCKSCKGSGGPFAVGNIYKYQLEGSTTTSLPGSDNTVTTLGISAVAEVFAESKCQHVLKLSDVVISGADGKKYNGLSAECAKPVKFSYDDGKLQELCAEADDRGAALNIKRAVISLLSSAKQSDYGSDATHENDVFGICPTEFSFSKDGTKVTIQKSRNLNRCALREELNFPFPSTPYQAVQSSFGAFETSPLLGAKLTVNQELEGGVLKKATGEEDYIYRPLVNPEAGAKVVVKYTLTLQGSSAGSIPANVNSPRVVYFEKAHDADGAKNADAISAALQKATAALDPVATSEAAKSFAHLVRAIEQGSKADILQVYNGAQGKTAKGLFLDGLLYAGSAESVEAAAELLSSQQISADSALRWYLDLNFVKHTSRGSLKALLPLLASDKVPVQAYLGIGAVAGKFYLQHPSLADAPELKDLLTKLAAPLDAGCKTDSHDKENKIIASLKGLRNTRHLSDEVTAKVVACAADKSAKTRVRAAAVEAFFADPAKKSLKESATAILKDVEEDAELRIKAYLALVQAPCPHVADTVKQLVDTEPINQVGSFVVSHLRNLRASVSPDKEAAKQFLGNIISKKRFPIDQRKFSQNYEVSYSLDAINAGAVGEVNRIFSQKSFIPRSVSLNLTTQLFGHSLNLAEVGLRAENLEWHLEKYFGPKGLLKTKGIKFVDKVGDDVEEAVKKAKEAAARPKRSVSKDQTVAATNKIELGPDYDDRDTDLDLSVKLFGSDIAWFNYHYDRLDADKLKQKLYGEFDQTLDKTKALDIDYKKARQFLDVGVSYPTGLGLALKVKVNGNSAVNIKVKGNADLKAIYQHPQTAHVALQVVPSANIELASLLTVDADVVEAGVKVSANIHSSTGSDITIKVLDGYGVDVKLGLPVKKQDILNFNSDVVSIVREKQAAEIESPIKFTVKRQEHGGCFDQLSALTGLTVCGEVSIPLEGFKVLSPAYGPTRASLRLEKDDESLTVYHFKAHYNNKEPNQVSVEVLLDTPNSKNNRKLGVNIHASSKPQKQLTITLASPYKEAVFEGLVIDTETEQAISAKLLSDGIEYSLKAGAHVTADGNKKKYEPILEYKYPEAAKSERSWIGRKGATKGGRNQQSSSVSVTGAVFVEKKPDSPYRKYELKGVTLTTPRNKVTVDGTVTVDADLVATDLKASYDKDSFSLNSKVQKQGDNKYIAKIEFVPTQYPDFGASIKWEYERAPHKLENKLVVVHGPNLNSETSRLSIQQLLTYKYESAKDFEFHTENSVSYPLLAISAAVKGGATPKSANYDIDITYDKSNIKSKLDAKTGAKNPLDYSVDFEGAAFGNSVHLLSKHDRLTQTKSKFANTLELKPGGKYQLNAVTEFNVKSGDILQSLDAEIKMPKDPKNIKVKTKVVMNNKENEIEFEIVAGAKHIIDFEYERQKKPDPSGKFKLSVPKFVEGEGSFEVKSEKVNGAFHVNIVKTGRKIEGKVDLTKSQSQVKGTGELLWDAQKDPSKKIHIETDTTISGKTIDSKNTLQVQEHKGEVNVKGSLEGSLTDGTLIGDAEVVLPNGRVLAAKVNRLVHLGPEDNKIEGTWELYEFASKGAQPRKVILKIAAKNVNPVKVQFDGQVDLTYVTPEKQDVVLHVVGKKIPQADKWSISGQGSVSGSLIKYPLHTKLNAEVSDQLLKGPLTADKKFPPAHYDFEFKAGNDIAINSNGKVNGNQLNNDIEITLPADLPVSSVKWHTANNVDIFGPDEAGHKIATSNSVYWNKEKFVKFTLEDAIKDNSGEGKITLESHALSSRTLTYKVTVNDKDKKGAAHLTLAWEGKTADFAVEGDVGSNPIHVSVVSNVPEHGKFQVDYQRKVLDKDSGEVSLTATGKDKKLVYQGKYSKNPKAPFVDLSLELPEGLSRFYTKMEEKGEGHVSVDTKINWPRDGALDFNGEINYNSLDSFLVKVFMDSPKLNVNKVEFEASSQPAKSAGKKIGFHGKSGDKEISGNLALVASGTFPNVQYKGNGILKVGEQTYPLKFELKSEQEPGKKYQHEVDIEAGKHHYTSHTLLEMDQEKKSFKFDRVAKLCVESSCSEDVLKSHSHRTGLVDYESGMEVKLGLLAKIMGSSSALAIKSNYKRTGWQHDNLLEVIDGSTELLNYHSYVKDNHAGVEVAFPKRTIAIESTYDLAKGKKPVFKVETNFWLDKKNNPNDKTSLLLASETTKLPDGIASSSEAKFNSPGLKELTVKGELNVNTKDRTINGKLEADVFAKKNQKIVVDYKASAKKDQDSYSAHDTLHIHSKALPIDAQVERKFHISKQNLGYILTAYYVDSKNAKRESIVKMNVKPLSQELVVKVPEGTIIAMEYNFKKDGKALHGTVKAEIVGQHYENEIDLKPYRLKYKSISMNEDKTGSCEVDVGAEPGQLAEASLKFNNKPVASLEVALDDAHFLKSKPSYNTDTAKEVIQFYKAYFISLAKSANHIGKESAAKLASEVNDKVEDIRKALPNFKPAVDHYKKELDQLKEEVKSSNIAGSLNKTFGTLFAQISTILHEVAVTAQHLLEILNQGLEKITQSVKATIPKLKESYEKISKIVFDLTESALKLINSLVDCVLDKIKEHQKEIQEITDIVSDFLQDVGKLTAVSFSEIQKEIKDFVTVLWDQIQALPAYSMIQEKIQELKNFKIPDQYWENYHEIITTAVNYLPTPELQELVKSLSQYFEKIVKQKPINKEEAVQELYKLLIAALKSVLKLATIDGFNGDAKSVLGSNFLLPVPSFDLIVAPPGTFRFSVLNWIRSSDLPTIYDLYHTYRPKHHPLDFIPPFYASAQLLGGTEFFTFDKKHFSFKGSCSYILSTDAIDGNFTLVANMEGGKLKSIAAFDHENSVELLHDDNVLINGQPGDLPVKAGELHLWRRFDAGTGFATTSGVMFFCTPHLHSCAFSVNGFYFGKTRGLLGTYNNEPYDDALLPQGKLAKSTAEFANSWKVSPQCGDGAVHEQPAAPQPECDKLFAGDSSLRGCFSYENPDRFREACNRQVAEASGETKQEKACNIAQSYTGYCYYVHFVQVNLPDHCGKCQVGSQTIQVGESAPVKTPQKQADIVFVVQQLEDNEEVFNNLVTPLVSTLTNDLKEKGITDVNFALVGYGAPHQRWPSIYTFNGKYNQFPGTSKNIYFAKPTEVADPKLSDKIEEIYNKVSAEIGISKEAEAFKEALKYPFRPEASKTVIGVLAQPCEKATLPLKALRMLLHGIGLLKSGITANLVLPIKDLHIEGKDEKTAANIVGFDSETVYTQSEAKRKVLKGDEEAFKNLKYENEACIEFALGTNGAVFSSSNFVKGKPQLRKNFMQVVANKLTEELTSVELREECKCELERGMIVRTRCKVTGRKEKEALTKGGVKGGVKG